MQIVSELKLSCVRGGGSVSLPRTIKKDLQTVAKIHNINKLERGIKREARLIYSRVANCPREPRCYDGCAESNTERLDGIV